MSQVEDNRLDENVSSQEELTVTELAGVIAACRSVRSAKSVAESLLDVGQSYQMLLGVADDAQRALVFDEVDCSIAEFTFDGDGLNWPPERVIDLESPHAREARAAMDENRLNWIHPRFSGARDGLS